MKKNIALLLVLVMVFTLTACGGGKDNDANLGKYVGATVEVFGEDVNISEIYAEGENYIELRSGGKCVFTLDGDSASGKWKLDGNDIVLTIEDVDSTGTLKDGVLTIDFMGEGITMTFVKDGATVKTEASSKPTDEPTDEPQSLGDAWWGGDWYGWWIVKSAGGSYSDLVNSYWDACARISFYEDGSGCIRIWDEDSAFDDHMIDVDVSFGAGTTDHGCMMSEGGYFYDDEVGHADWIVDPGASTVSSIDDMICIDGTYEDPEDDGESWFTYAFYLRPWGMDWEDVRYADTEDFPYDDMMPNHYDDWYLPLLEAGCESAAECFELSDNGAPDDGDLEGNVTVVGDAVYDYNDKGAILFSYPSDVFTFDAGFGIDALETADGALRMTFYADRTQEELETTLGNLDSYSDYEDFTKQEMMIAGYEAVQITYNCWGDYYIDTYIQFGDDAGEYQGICISVRSYNSFEECRSAAVESVLYSIQVVN
ncbi:MAG: hypothetical protein ACI3V2_10425 [Faecousia sp.]